MELDFSRSVELKEVCRTLVSLCNIYLVRSKVKKLRNKQVNLLDISKFIKH